MGGRGACIVAVTRSHRRAAAPSRGAPVIARTAKGRTDGGACQLPGCPWGTQEGALLGRAWDPPPFVPVPSPTPCAGDRDARRLAAPGVPRAHPGLSPAAERPRRRPRHAPCQTPPRAPARRGGRRGRKAARTRAPLPPGPQAVCGARRGRLQRSGMALFERIKTKRGGHALASARRASAFPTPRAADARAHRCIARQAAAPRCPVSSHASCRQSSCYFFRRHLAPPPLARHHAITQPHAGPQARGLAASARLRGSNPCHS